MINKPNVISFMFFIGLAAVCFFQYSCEKKETTKPHQLAATSLLDKFNENKLNHKKGEYHIGQVNLYATEDGWLAISLITDNEKNINYILQSKNPIEIQSVMKKAEVLFLRKSLIINSLEEKKTFLVSIGREHELGIEINQIPYDHIFKGYGLIRHVTDNSNSSQITLRSSLNCKCCDNSILTSTTCQRIINDGCDAGGAGSVSCQLSVGDQSCSVECDGHSTACCWQD